MSADDYMPCPFCSLKNREEIDKLNKDIEEAYHTMVAEKYDEFKYETEVEIKRLENQIEDVLFLSIYGKNSYGFNSEFNFCIDIEACCDTCKRRWIIKVETEPVFGNGEQND